MKGLQVHENPRPHMQYHPECTLSSCQSVDPLTRVSH